MVRFRDALSGPGLSAIAEIKRRSPSAGDLRPGADPAALASELARAGAAAVSVLVDERFGGSLDDLRAARVATGLPLLGKGFFRSEDALAALAEAGADAVLLLLRDLDDIEACGFRRARASWDWTRSSRPTTPSSSSGRSASAPTRSGSTRAISPPSES